MAGFKAYLIERRTDETQERKVDEKIGVIFASSVETAADIIDRQIKEKFPDDQESVILKTSRGFGMLCLISLPIIDSPSLLSAELVHQKMKIDYMNRISA